MPPIPQEIITQYETKDSREGGAAYITVPFGKNFREVPPHWRVYNLESISDRLKQSFQIEKLTFCISGPVIIDGQRREIGDPIGEEVFNYDGDDPHISVLIKMRKI